MDLEMAQPGPSARPGEEAAQMRGLVADGDGREPAPRVCTICARQSMTSSAFRAVKAFPPMKASKARVVLRCSVLVFGS